MQRTKHLRYLLAIATLLLGQPAWSAQQTVVSIDLGISGTEIQSAIGLATSLAESIPPTDSIGLVAADEIVRFIIEPLTAEAFIAEFKQIKEQLRATQTSNFAAGLERSLAMFDPDVQDKQLVLVSSGFVTTSDPDADGRYTMWGQQILIPDAASQGVALTVVVPNEANSTDLIEAANMASADNRTMELPRASAAVELLGRTLNGLSPTPVILAQSTTTANVVDKEAVLPTPEATPVTADLSPVGSANTANNTRTATSEVSASENTVAVIASTAVPAAPVVTDIASVEAPDNAELTANDQVLAPQTQSAIIIDGGDETIDQSGQTASAEKPPAIAATVSVNDNPVSVEPETVPTNNALPVTSNPEVTSDTSAGTASTLVILLSLAGISLLVAAIGWKKMRDRQRGTLKERASPIAAVVDWDNQPANPSLEDHTLVRDAPRSAGDDIPGQPVPSGASEFPAADIDDVTIAYTANRAVPDVSDNQVPAAATTAHDIGDEFDVFEQSINAKKQKKTEQESI